jgi:hypothetical protein
VLLLDYHLSDVETVDGEEGKQPPLTPLSAKPKDDATLADIPLDTPAQRYV